MEAEREEVGGAERIALRFPFSEDTNDVVRRIPGVAFHRGIKLWHAPLDWGICKRLRMEFGDDLVIGPSLLNWAKREQGRQGHLKRTYNAPKTADSVPLPVVEEEAPNLHAALLQRGYQTLVPAFCREVGSYFNGSQPGTGKTIETLASLVERRVGNRVLIIAPSKALRVTWLVQIQQWIAPDFPLSMVVADIEEGSMEERDEVIAQYGADSKKSGNRFDFLLIHPEMLSWKFECPVQECNGKRKTCPARSDHSKRPLYPHLFKIAFNAEVMDETHRYMMHANTRSASASGWGYGAQKLRTAPDVIKIGMSGTPFKGKPRSFWNVLHWLDAKKYSSEHKWTETFFEMDTSFNPFARNARPTNVMREDRRELFEAEMDAIMIRHTKAELRKLNPNWAPPEKVHAPVILPIAGKQKRAYEEMVKDASARLDNGTLMATGILAERTRLKQLASSYGKMTTNADGDAAFLPALPSNKWDWIKEALEERGLARSMNDGAIKIVIASQFTSLLEVLGGELGKLGINYFFIRGGRNKEAARFQQAWQSPQTDTRVMLLSIQAAGYSIDLDAADDLVVVDEPEDPDTTENLEDRIHRTSRTDHQVTIYHLISNGTIDAGIAVRNLELDRAQKAILDERRSVPYARLVIEEREDAAVDDRPSARPARRVPPRRRPVPAQGAVPARTRGTSSAS